MKRIDFLATDGVILNGLLYESNNKTKNKEIVIAIHGMSSNCFKKRDEIIAKNLNEEGIDYFCFNNRGSDLVRYLRKDIDGKKEKKLGGTSFEDVLESYEDIVGAILKIKELGYENIYLQGHSLGCTKIVYTFNELKDEESKDILQNIKGIILLSLIDIPKVLKVYLRENFEEYLKLAQDKESTNNLEDFMPKEAFIHPISVKTFLRYARDNKEIDFARYLDDVEFEKLNNIDVPIFMRWGNDKEMILEEADELVQKLRNNINNPKKNIDYIDGADHGYKGKEEILAKQIVEFIKNIKR